MTKSLDKFGLTMDTPLALPTSRAYRPPSWPPPKDWVCIEDEYGNEVARYGDHVWAFWPWAKKNITFNFGDGPKLNTRSPVIDSANADLLRQVIAWRVWGPNGARSVNTLIQNFAKPIRKIIALCSENGILASELYRYPVLIEKVAHSIAPSQFETVITELDRLRDARELLGFELLDKVGIQRLKAALPDHDTEQTEYIPPRIWTYVVSRLNDCIDDYLAHQKKIEACFAFCVVAYEQNNVVNKGARTGDSKRNPFQVARNGARGNLAGVTYHGPFSKTAQRFGIQGLLERWVVTHNAKFDIRKFGNYFQLIQTAALAYIVAFTLMRIEEAEEVRKDCLVWHDDPVYGQIPLIQSATTKTDPDDKGLWVTSPSVEKAVRVLTSIAKMRLSCVEQWLDESAPNLITYALEPWCRPSRAKLKLKPTVMSLGQWRHQFPQLFDLSQLTITEDDFRLAKSVCPTLNADLFRVGEPWHLAWHQFRRTGAVNMFASGEISDSSIQLQMKHLTRLMPLYYGRGNSALHLNDSARVALVNAQYEAMGRLLAEVHTDRFVSPYGEEHKVKLLATANSGEPVNLISEDDALRYEKAARQHLIKFRQTALGGCMNNSKCDGDCISSVGDCAGGDGKSPCAHVLFDRNRMTANQVRLEGVVQQLRVSPLDSPRYRSLEQEKRGLENYFAFINRN